MEYMHLIIVRITLLMVSLSGNAVVGEVQYCLGDLSEVLVEENVVSAGLCEFNAYLLFINL